MLQDVSSADTLVAGYFYKTTWISKLELQNIFK